MRINRSHLRPREAQVVQEWEQLFASPAWKLIIQRFEPRLEGTVTRLENAGTMKELGIAKGHRDVLFEILNLSSIVEAELQSKVAAQEAERREDIVDRGAMA